MMLLVFYNMHGKVSQDDADNDDANWLLHKTMKLILIISRSL